MDESKEHTDNYRAIYVSVNKSGATIHISDSKFVYFEHPHGTDSRPKSSPGIKRVPFFGLERLIREPKPLRKGGIRAHSGSRDWEFLGCRV